jgi:lantibiotic modifying enzyme
MILSFPQYLNKNPDVEKDVKKCIDFLISIQTREGNFPSSMDEIGFKINDADELIHWCHGASGVVWVCAKAYLVWREEKYLDACRKCSELVWAKGLIKKGPGICHGIAGNGYVHLLLYRLTNEQKYLYRAWKFAEFLENKEFKMNSRRPDNPFSLYEGLAGAVCYLVDLLNPNQAEFPFFDIFD